ncbi:RHS repeat-associated core domain-containing protein [Flavobacterium sp. CF136]|uniref:RHS repeat-associated core domain-containing protein n=1 Tax=Flavobacterium sp. (strain CF136) TaxID=1144313 RepID=UPI000271744E|nr:RHS repeat-associated core domain-containing protein [Flavobacterium sp. CF136]EJL60664.1 RHS repeat-associated core domain protein-containing protein [Flavobacterium sp. CF136]
MIYNKNIPVNFRVLILLAVFFFSAAEINAQSIAIDTNDSGVPLGGTGSYSLDMSSPGNFTDFRWEISPYDVSQFVGGTPTNQSTQVQLFWMKPGTHQITVFYYDIAQGSQNSVTSNVYVSASADMTDAITVVSNCKSIVLERKDPPAGVTYFWQSSADGTSTENSAKTITVNSGTEYFLRAKINSNNIWSATSGSIQYQLNPNAYLIWYLDADQDGLGNPNYYVKQCTDPSSASINYVLNNTDTSDGEINFTEDDGSPYTDKEFHWTYQVSYDVKGNITGVSKTYFDDLGKSDVSLSRDIVTGRVWGTETSYDNFGRPDKSSFLAPSNLFSLNKVSFLNPDYHEVPSNNSTTVPVNKIVGAVTSSQTITVSNTLTANGAVSPGLNVAFKGNNIVLENGFSVSGASGGVFTATPTSTSNNNETLSNGPFFSYYSDNNTLEPYQATATQPYSQTNYDTLNPGNVINVVGGNKINGDWRTGYSYTVPAAQEMYYVYGSDYYDGVVTSSGEEVITKFYKSVSVDANGVENVAFTDGEGNVLATARSGGTASYPVVSLIGTQGFVDVHIPAGITSSQIDLIGNESLYKIYDLKTGYLTTTLTGGNGYRIEAVTPPTTDPKTYITTSGTPFSYDFGNVLGIEYSVNYYDYAVNVYNKTGQLIKTVQPKGYEANSTIKAIPAHMAATATAFISTYTYNALGQVIQASSPDEGTSRFAYRNDGQIRYSQSALQTDTKVSYTDYDTLGRAIESGVITGSVGIWASAIANTDSGLITGTRSEQTFTIYDYPDNNTTSVALPTNLTLAGVLTTAGISTTNYTQKNLSGNVAVTYTKPGTAITAITWYSYDIYGRAEWIVQYNEGIGAKAIHYEYDYKGNVKKVLFQKDKSAELFVHQYTYNANDVLTKVETSTDNTTFTTQADYSYYLTGELKRVNIAQGTQGLDYVYTLGGQLKSINHPSLEAAKDPGGDSNDVFGLTLDYYNGDYLRTGRNITSSPTIGADYNGNIKAARWANKGIVGDFNGTTANQKGYLYSYDRNNFLTNAAYGNTSSSDAAISPTSSYKEGNLAYDANGNLKTLQRTNDAGTMQDNLTYAYNTDKNQLNSVADAAGASTGVNDIGTQTAGNYQYDAIGQMTRNNLEDINYYYNTQGLVTQVNKIGRPVVKFYYNERGQRIKKESYNTASPYTLTNTDYYILDLSGNVMTIYNQPNGSGAIVQKDLPIFGLSRLGVYNRASGTSTYEITDHLGNVRAVVQKNTTTGTTDIKSYADYYPFGELLPNRNSNSGNYRYAFQGQEKDGETEMEAFQLRLWDGRIGRWLSPDPYGQHSSPYLGMGNNPIGTIDPDGGWEWEISARWHAFWSGGKAFQSSKGDWGVQTAGKSSDGMYIQTDFGGKRYDVYRQAAAEKFMDDLADYRTFHPSEFGDISLWDDKFEGNRLESIASAFQIVNPEAPAMNFFKAANSGGRAFWSGAGTESKALAEGFETLGQTRAGKNLIKLTEGMDYYPAIGGKPASQAYLWWARLSTKYAEGASGTVHVFQNAEHGVGMQSIWRLYEYPTLLKNPKVTSIKYH